MYSKLRALACTKRGYRGRQYTTQEKEFKWKSQSNNNPRFYSRFSDYEISPWTVAAFGVAFSIPLGILIKKLCNGTNIVIASTRSEPKFHLKSLPFGTRELEPWISEDTVITHYDKHHRGYVNKLNSLLENQGEVGSLEGIVMREKKGDIFNMAAQVYNHDFYWDSMSPRGGGRPSGEIARMIDESFGSFEEFQKQFHDLSISHFGSGWTWLTYDPSLKILKILTTHDAKTPLTKGLHPILVCDIWEHAYYLDVRNEKGKYINRWWNVVNWSFANENLSKAKSFK